MAARSTFTRTSGSVITSAWANSLRDHVVPYSGITDGTTEGMLSVNTADDTLRIGNGSAGVAVANYGTWGTFTARISQNSGGSYNTLTPAECEWWRDGRDISGGGFLTVASAVGATAGNILLIEITGLPLPSNGLGGPAHLVGSFTYHDVGTTFYAGQLFFNSAGLMTMQAHNHTSSVGAAPSFAFAVNDQIWLNFRYRAASTT